MLNTADINDLSAKRMWILASALTVGVVATFTYFVVIAVCRDSMMAFARRSFGETAADFLPLMMILPSIGFFLAPLVRAEQEAKRYALICPECTTDLSRSSRRVIATRCCGSCGKQIVEGRRIRAQQAFGRLSRIEQRRLLVYWFWVWPILGLWVLAYRWIHPTGFNSCPPVLFLPGLIGTVATAWSYARTLDKRYVPQFFASVMVLCLGFNSFWWG